MKRGLALTTLFAVALVACSSKTGGIASPTRGVPATVSTSSPIDGMWEGPTLTVGEAHADVPSRYWAGVFVENLHAKETVQFELRLQDGRWTEVESVDHRQPDIGQAGAFTVEGDLIHMNDGLASYTYRWTISAGALRLTLLEDDSGPTGSVPDRIFQHLIYEAHPFTKAD